jgi:hypothetical protein
LEIGRDGEGKNKQDDGGKERRKGGKTREKDREAYQQKVISTGDV